MININKNESNTIVLTLTEKVTLPTPYYLFSFKNDINGDVVNFNAQDQSLFAQRYNLFTITETIPSGIDLTGATINLKPGMYSYTIYEQTDPVNLVISAATAVVEVGKVIVEGEDNTIPEVYR